MHDSSYKVINTGQDSTVGKSLALHIVGQSLTYSSVPNTTQSHLSPLSQERYLSTTVLDS